MYDSHVDAGGECGDAQDVFPSLGRYVYKRADPRKKGGEEDVSSVSGQETCLLIMHCMNMYRSSSSSKALSRANRLGDEKAFLPYSISYKRNASLFPYARQLCFSVKHQPSESPVFMHPQPNAQCPLPNNGVSSSAAPPPFFALLRRFFFLLSPG